MSNEDEVKQAWLDCMGVGSEHVHTFDWEEHPDGYDDPCACQDCRSYAADDAELCLLDIQT